MDPVFLAFLFGLFLLGLALRRWLLGSFFLALGVAALYFLSTVPGANLLIRPLEGRYPALLSPPEVPVIVVLSGGENYSDDRPILSNLPSSTLARVVEGVRLFWALGGEPDLWFIGGAGFAGPGVPLMAQAAWELGVPREKVHWLTTSRNTWEDAAAVAQELSPFPFILVTSALHMPRAMETFLAHNLAPVPAPCGFLSLSPRSFRAYLPSAQALSASASALREHFALLWYRLRYGIHLRTMRLLCA